MTLMTSRTGTVKDLDLDIDAICAYEADHPDWSLAQLMEGMPRMRFTDLNLMATFIGYADYRAFVDDGFSMEDLAGTIEGSRYLGFTGSPGGD